MINEEFKKYLENSFNARDTELFTLEVEIRNFKYSIDQIENNYSDIEEMVQFKEELKQTLKFSEVNKLKCMIMRDSFKKQLDDLNSTI